MKDKGILNYFNGSPREGQSESLLALERHWDEADVFVLIAPTASGKSRIASCLQEWLKAQRKHSTYMVHQNILLSQYATQPPSHLLHLRSMSDVNCHVHGNTVAEAWGRCKGACGMKCPYKSMIVRSKAQLTVGCNPYSWLAHKLGKSRKGVLIVDEAHTLVNTMQDIGERIFWRTDWGFPDDITEIEHLHKWACKARETAKASAKRKLQCLIDETASQMGSYIITSEVAERRGIPERCLRLTPLNVKEQLQSFCGKIDKFVLLSATLNDLDLDELGLAGRRVKVLEIPSPIPPERRPVIALPRVSHAFASEGADWPRCLETIVELMTGHPERGVLHMTYSLLEKLRDETSLPGYDRLRFATRENKAVVVDSFLQITPDNLASGDVLVCAGLEEGLDLVGDLARWQVIVKIPWLSQSDPALLQKVAGELGERWYTWQAVKKVSQCAGRVCRTPDDYGITYIIDKSVERIPRDSFPSWLSITSVLPQKM